MVRSALSLRRAARHALPVLPGLFFLCCGLAACDAPQEERPQQETRTEAPAAPQVEILPPVRQVTPSRMIPGPVVTGAVERIEAALPPPAPPRPRRLPVGVVTLEGANLLVGRGVNVRVILRDTRTVDPALSCRLSSGSERDCLSLSLIGARRVVRMARIACEARPEDMETSAGTAPVPASCRIGEEDLALRLIALGWLGAGPDAPTAYLAAEDSARVAGRGLFASATTDPFSR